MDIFLAKLTQQAMNYAIRSGISITSGFAIHQCSRLLKVRLVQARHSCCLVMPMLTALERRA